MVQDYTGFIEENTTLKKYDRVVCHGNAKRFDLNNGRHITLDYEGQTGIITKILSLKTPIYEVFFDNLFSPYLKSFDSKSKCSATLYGKNLEKIKVPESKYPLTNFSPKIRKLLEYTDYMSYPYKLDVNYIDVGDDPNYITYLTNSRVVRLKKGDDPFKSTLRDKMSIGKFLKKLNPYSDNVSLEKKVNIYKAMYDTLIASKNIFKMVQGRDIIEWYQEKRYFSGSGPLNNSCMRNCRDKLQLYNDPSRVAMLTLINPENKLLGRALVWNVTEPNITYMDRVYTVFPDDTEKFYIFAAENGWYNYRDNSEDTLIIRYDYDIGDEYKNPYMDTFKVFVKKDGNFGNLYLTNDQYDVDGCIVELEETESEPDPYDNDDDY